MNPTRNQPSGPSAATDTPDNAAANLIRTLTERADTITWSEFNATRIRLYTLLGDPHMSDETVAAFTVCWTADEVCIFGRAHGWDDASIERFCDPVRSVMRDMLSLRETEQLIRGVFPTVTARWVDILRTYSLQSLREDSERHHILPGGAESVGLPPDWYGTWVESVYRTVQSRIDPRRVV